MYKIHYLPVDWHWGKSITIIAHLKDGGYATVNLSFENNNPGVAFISDLIVCETSRKKGYGKQLITLCEGLAEQEGMFRIDLKAEKRVPFLKHMYESLGYKQVDEDSIWSMFSKLITNRWIKVDDKDMPLPKYTEVLAYNKEWINEDFCPNGIRIGFLSDVGFFSAKWNNDQDCYDTHCEEGDDYILEQIQSDGTAKKWSRYENGKAVEGYLPNMPTHYMLIPSCKE